MRGTRPKPKIPRLSGDFLLQLLSRFQLPAEPYEKRAGDGKRDGIPVVPQAPTPDRTKHAPDTAKYRKHCSDTFENMFHGINYGS